jgi:23S rRNA (pseudouridine1915-N3)-methyltransferase
MKITILSIGKTKASFFKEGMKEYLDRLKHYIPVVYNELADLKNTKNLSVSEIKNKEGELLQKAIPSGHAIVLLDDKGKQFSSEDFAAYFERKMILGPDICFIIGGAYGFSDEIYSMANEKISLSKMTFSHQMVRLILFEQVYRAFTIINREPYHHA